MELSGTVNVDIFDLILMPVDEWAVELSDPTNNAVELGSRHTLGQRLYFDAITDVRKWRTVPLIQIASLAAGSSIVDKWLYVGSAEPHLEPNVAQRIWFFNREHPSSANNELRADVGITNTISLTTSPRYYSMRGDR